MGNFKEEIACVRGFVFDVDGVFTDGGIIVTPEGDFMRKYNAKDGYAVQYAIRCGYQVAIITAGRGRCLDVRFEMLGVTHLFTNCHDKMAALQKFMADTQLTPAEVLYMGDDIPDMEAMQTTGLPVCPADATPDIIEISRYVSQYRGGEGCVRDVIEQVLRARGDWMKTTNGLGFLPSR